MLKIAIMDDEPEYISLVSRMTEDCMRKLETAYEIKEYKNSESLLEDLRQEICFDIYLLDVQLSESDGLEVGRQIREKYIAPVLIFITNHMEYAVDAFEVNTYRYIPKRTLTVDLPKAYEHLIPMLEKKKKEEGAYIIERYSNREKIFYRNIYYCQKEGKYVTIIHKDGKSQVRRSMKAFYKEIQAENFLMIDKAYIVNMRQVSWVKNYQVYIINGDKLPVSRPRWKFVKEAFVNNRR